jgi:hypothetical protein
VALPQHRTDPELTVQKKQVTTGGPAVIGAEVFLRFCERLDCDCCVDPEAEWAPDAIGACFLFLIGCETVVAAEVAVAGKAKE